MLLRVGCLWNFGGLAQRVAIGGGCCGVGDRRGRGGRWLRALEGAVVVLLNRPAGAGQAVEKVVPALLIQDKVGDNGAQNQREQEPALAAALLWRKLLLRACLCLANRYVTPVTQGV